MGNLSNLSDAQLQAIASGQSTPSSGLSATSPSGGVTISARPATPEELAGMSDTDLQEIANRDNPAADALQSFPTGVAKGAAGTVGGLGDLADLMGGGVGWLANHMGVDQKGADAIGNLVADIPGLAFSQKFQHNDSARANQQIQNQIGQYYEPQTAWGRATETLGANAPLALLPGGALTRLARVAVPSATSDTAGEIARASTHNPDVETLARGAGGLAGGIGQRFGEALANAPMRGLRMGVDDAGLQRIGDVIQAGKNSGIEVSPLEAAAQAGYPKAAGVLDFLESTPQGQAALGPYFAQRPGQVAASTNALADAIHGRLSNPSLLGLEAQKAGEGVIDAAKAERLRLANAAGYTAADPQSVDSGLMSAILGRIGTQMGEDQTGLLAPQLAKLRSSLTAVPESAGSPAVAPERVQVGNHFVFQGGSPEVPGSPAVPVTNIGQLSTARNHWLDVLDNSPPERLSNQQAGILRGHVNDVDALLKQNPDYLAGNNAYADASRNIVEPITSGPVGTVAGTSDVPTLTAALYRPQNVSGGQETGQALGMLGQQNPTLPKALLAQYIRNTANGALSDLQPGENQWGGARLAVRLAGPDEAEKALYSGFNAAGADTGKLDDYLTAMRATGKRLTTGSRTHLRGEMATELGQPLAHPMSMLDLFDWPGMFAKATGGAIYKRQLGKLADFTTSDNPVDQLDFLRRAQQPAQGTPTALLSALLGASAGASP